MPLYPPSQQPQFHTSTSNTGLGSSRDNHTCKIWFRSLWDLNSLTPMSPIDRHTTITGATRDQVCRYFLMARQCSLRSHEVRHEFPYLPDCPVGLLGKQFLCKLRAQITFDSDGTESFKLRGPEADSNPHGCARGGMAALCP
jgi:hypothetical protein